MLDLLLFNLVCVKNYELNLEMKDQKVLFCAKSFPLRICDCKTRKALAAQTSHTERFVFFWRRLGKAEPGVQPCYLLSFYATS